MTVADLIARLIPLDPHMPVAVLHKKRKTNRLDNPEYEALDVLDVEKRARCPRSRRRTWRKRK